MTDRKKAEKFAQPFIGAGTGRLNGVAGASISFIFTDQGEPGTSDTESMTDSFNNVVLSVPTTALTFGLGLRA